MRCKEHKANPCHKCQPRWAIQIFPRMNGLVEDICEHGIGHPNKFLSGEYYYSVHGCDGCCMEER